MAKRVINDPNLFFNGNYKQPLHPRICSENGCNTNASKQNFKSVRRLYKDNYLDAEQIGSEVDFKFGAETSRLDISARILGAKNSGKSLYKMPIRNIITKHAIPTIRK